MRTTLSLATGFGAVLMSVGAVVSAHAAEAPPFYNPSNAASSSGKTVGYELYRTIGCPGRQLLDVACPVPAAAPVAVASSEPAPAPEKLVLVGVNFDFDKATLRPEDIVTIDRDAAALYKWGNVKIEVAGHTDSTGPAAYNMGLSLRRAETVRNYLISKGVAADRLFAKGYGESQPVADNATKEGRFKNRRVELIPLK